MSVIRSHRDLRAWQLAHSLGLSVYKLSASFPKDERFGLTSQLRRAAVSVASNIAEGYGRGTTSDYVRYLRVARGSLYEIDTQIQFARDLGYVDGPTHESFDEEWNSVSKVLAGLIRSIDTNA